MLIIENVSPTFERTIKVQFASAGGSVREGDFKAVFKRVEQERINEFLDTENGFNTTDVVDEVLDSVSGIGRSATEELPADEARTWVMKQPECVAALFQDFLKAMRPVAGAEKTSKKRR